MGALDIVIPPEILLGQADERLVELPIFGCRLQPELQAPLMLLAEDARDAGFQLAVASSYRSFERQLAIWNAKALGQRPVLDDRGQPIDLQVLEDWEKVQAILRWSALPGSSRHHWGTDLDVYDARCLAPDYALQLTPEECEGEGPFAPFHVWLSERIAAGNSHGFYRPYAVDRAGVAPEPWHLSYGPLAEVFARQLTEPLLREAIAAADIALKDTLLARLPDILHRYVRVPNSGAVS